MYINPSTFYFQSILLNISDGPVISTLTTPEAINMIYIYKMPRNLVAITLLSVGAQNIGIKYHTPYDHHHPLGFLKPA
jgi:hypothetical protein